VGARHALFPIGTHWALSLSRAVCSPTPLFAACEVLDLMAGSLRPLPAGVCRVRPLRPVRSPPAGGGAPDVVQTRLRVHASRRHRCRGDGAGFWPAVGPALRVWPLSSQAAFALQLGDAFFRAAQVRRFHGLCRARSLPAVASPLRAPSEIRTGPFGGGGPAELRDCVLVSYSSSLNPLGNCVDSRVETPREPDSVRLGF
jgi:hypothetical protein